MAMRAPISAESSCTMRSPSPWPEAARPVTNWVSAWETGADHGAKAKAPSAKATSNEGVGIRMSKGMSVLWLCVAKSLKWGEGPHHKCAPHAVNVGRRAREAAILSIVCALRRPADGGERA